MTGPSHAGRGFPPWYVVVPVKRLVHAKTRLTGVAGPHRSELALAFAADTVAAAASCPLVSGVIVVTDDTVAAEVVAGLGATVVPDEPDAGLNPAVQYGAERARAAHPGCGVGVLSADLPALLSSELATALAAAALHPAAFVPDSAGRGTTLLTATAESPLRPAFGAGSRDAHRATGAHELAVAGITTLRRDVDTPADLAAAIRLGVGPCTSAVLHRLDALP